MSRFVKLTRWDGVEHWLNPDQVVDFYAHADSQQGQPRTRVRFAVLGDQDVAGVPRADSEVFLGRPDQIADRLGAPGLDGALREVLAWSRETFPNRTALPTARHLAREAAELIDAIERDDPVHYEVADVLMLLTALADCTGVDLEGAVREKLPIVKARRWAPPDAQGVREHVRAVDGDREAV